MKIECWLKDAIQSLKGTSASDPELDPIWMMCEVLGVGRAQLRSMMNDDVDVETIHTLDKWLERRKALEPLQYILGNQPFMGLNFKVDKRVLIPRQDTETLCEVALDILKHIDNPKVADICTGSGAIAVTIAKLCPKASVLATDISADALDLARENAILNGVHVEFLLGDMLKPIENRKFHMILSNPPYIPTKDVLTLQGEVQHEPNLALDGGDDGLLFYRLFATNAKELLYDGGYLCLEVGYGQASVVAQLLKKEFNTSIYKDLCGVDRIVVASNKAGV